MKKRDSFDKKFERFLKSDDGKICFVEQDGKLWFVYQEIVTIPTKHHASSWKTYKANGIVPDDVVAQGVGAVKKYAQQKVNAEIKKQKATDKKWEEFERNPNTPISVTYGGVLLEGRIISAEDTTIKVRLEKPAKYQGESFVIYGFASAVAGHKRFKKLGEFTDNALETARGLLVEIYKQKKHELENKEVLDLAKKLNREKK